MFNVIHISKANFYPNYPYFTLHFWEICIIFRTWKQHSQICKFATDERSLSEKAPENFKQQDSMGADGGGNQKLER